MKDLDWFTARNLAYQGRAIRRAGWEYWLIRRFFGWLIIGADDGAETRRVVQAADWRDSEALAKDWTDEPWSGGTYPPCATPGPAAAPAPNATGGQGAWTTTAGQCGGGGTGGNIPAVPVDLGGSVYDIGVGDDEGSAGTFEFSVTARTTTARTPTYAELAAGWATTMWHVDYPLLVADGGSCWTRNAAVAFRFVVTNGTAPTPANILPTSTENRMVVYMAPPGHTLDAAPPAVTLLSGGVPVAVSGLRLYGPVTGAALETTPSPSWTPATDAAKRDAHMWGIRSGEATTVVPGGTWRFRAIVYRVATGSITWSGRTIATGDVVDHRDTSVTFAPSCYDLE